MWMHTKKENPTITFISMEVTNIRATGNLGWTCTNLMARTWWYGWHKWNNISTLAIFWKMKLNYMSELFTCIKRDDSCGSGIKDSTQGSQLGTCSQNPFVTALIRNLTFWVISLAQANKYSMGLHCNL